MPLFKRPHLLMLRILSTFYKKILTTYPKTHLHLQKLTVGKTGGIKRLLQIVNRLAEERKLKFQPTFLYPIVSSLGYMNDDMNVLLKEIGKCFKENQSKERRFDGLHPGVLKDGSRRN